MHPFSGTQYLTLRCLVLARLFKYQCLKTHIISLMKCVEFIVATSVDELFVLLHLCCQATVLFKVWCQ